MNINEIDPTIRDAVLLAHHEATQGSKYGEKVGEWHIISTTLHKGEGWESIARIAIADGRKKPLSLTESQLNDLAQDIENHVKAYRKKMGIMPD